MKSVYSAVRTDSLYKAEYVLSSKVNSEVWPVPSQLTDIFYNRIGKCLQRGTD